MEERVATFQSYLDDRDYNTHLVRGPRSEEPAVGVPRNDDLRPVGVRRPLPRPPTEERGGGGMFHNVCV